MKNENHEPDSVSPVTGNTVSRSLSRKAETQFPALKNITNRFSPSIKMSPRKRKDVDTTTYAGRFAARLRILREKKKMTVEELAEKSEVPKKTLYNWEQGIRTPPFDKLPELAEHLETTPRNLMPKK